MKKFTIIMVACALFAACQNSGKTSSNGDNAQDSVLNDTAVGADTLVYEGTVPAADGPGIRYTLHIASDSTKGYHLTETYLEAENGKDKSFEYDGQVEAVSKTVDGKSLNGLKLNLGKDNSLYFKQVGDSVLRMVNDEFEEAVSEANYDLKLK